MTGLSKILQVELAASLKSRIVLPLQLSCERDEALARLTEGRVPACTHDLVPDLLRTKPEPQAEQRLQQFNHKASTLSYDTAQVILVKIKKQIKTATRIQLCTDVSFIYFILETSSPIHQSSKPCLGNNI